MHGIVGKVLRGLLLTVLCMLVFDIPSAYVVARGGSPWLALLVGLATFPVTPLVWHALAERKRKQAPPPKPVTRGWERLLLRSAAVGIVVIGALGAVVGPGRLLDSARNNLLWFVPGSSVPLVADSPLFAHVPPDAEGIVWLRLDEGTRDQLVASIGVAPDAARVVQASDAVLAWKPDAILLVEGGDAVVVALVQDGLAKINEVLRGIDEVPAAAIPTGAAGKTPDGTQYIVSEGWRNQVSKGRPSALLELVPRAPDDAFLVVVAKPASPGAKLPRWAVAYARLQSDRVVVRGSLEMPDEATAQKSWREGNRVREDLERQPCWKAGGGRVTFDRIGTKLEAEISIALDGIRAYVACERT